MKVSVEDKIKTVNLYNAIKGTLGKPIQVVFTFEKGEIPVGQTFTRCFQDLDRSITPPPKKEYKTGFNNSEKKSAIINFDIG